MVRRNKYSEKVMTPSKQKYKKKKLIISNYILD